MVSSRSPEGSIRISAPIAAASSAFLFEGSTAMMRPAPASLKKRITPSPIIPAPITRAVSRDRSLDCLTACRDVAKGSASGHGVHDDALAFRETSHPTACGFDRPRDLVAHYRAARYVEAVAIAADVGAADAAILHSDEDFVFRDLGRFPFGHFQPARLAKDQCAHHGPLYEKRLPSRFVSYLFAGFLVSLRL